MEQQENERIEKQEQLDQACPKPLESFDSVPEVEDSDEESVVEDLVDESVGLDSVAESREVVELRSNVEEEIGEDTGRIALSMEEACNVGSQFSDAVELSLAGLEAPGQPVPSTLRAEFEKETQTDDSLKAWRELATKREKGFSWDGPLIRKETEGPAGETRSLIAVPLRMRKSIMSMAHNNFGHMSDKRTRYIVGRKFVWPGMARDVSRWCKTCVICQKQGKNTPQRAPMCQMPVMTEPFEAVAIDLVGPFPRAKSGYKYLLTMICLASRYPEALPLKTITAEDVAEGLVELFCRHGLPRSILSDQGKQFKCALFEQLCEKLKVKKIQSSPYHPQSNGVVERFHGTLVPMLRKALEKGIDWPTQIKYCLFAIRCAPNRSTGFSPFEILLGRDVRSPLDLVVDELDSSESETIPVREWIVKMNDHLEVIRDYVRENGLNLSDARKVAHDKGTRVRKFPAGTMVLLRTPGLSGKLEENWEGPFEVESMPNAVNVKLKIPGRAGKSRVVHVNNIKEMLQDKVAVHRLVVSAEEPSVDVEVLKLSGNDLDSQKREQIQRLKDEWAHVLTDKPGIPRTRSMSLTQEMLDLLDPNLTLSHRLS